MCCWLKYSELGSMKPSPNSSVNQHCGSSVLKSYRHTNLSNLNFLPLWKQNSQPAIKQLLLLSEMVTHVVTSIHVLSCWLRARSATLTHTVIPYSRRSPTEISGSESGPLQLHSKLQASWNCRLGSVIFMLVYSSMKRSEKPWKSTVGSAPGNPTFQSATKVSRTTQPSKRKDVP